MVVALVVWVACTPSETPPAPAADPLAYAPGLDAPPDAPAFDADAMAVAIADAVDAARHIQGGPVFDAYLAVMAEADGACPDYYALDGNLYWYDQCTTAAGARFSGYSFYTHYVDYQPGDGNIYNGQQLYGVAQVWDAAGHELDLGGSATEVVLTPPDGSYAYWYSVAQGSFAWDGAGTEGTWVTPGMAPDIVLTAIDYPPANGHMFRITGGLGDLAGPYDAVVFDDLTLIDAGLGGACPEEPGGAISVRGTDGYWYDLYFDGQVETEDAVDGAACDGCADVWYQGRNLGPLCVDLGALTDWEDAPW